MPTTDPSYTPSAGQEGPMLPFRRQVRNSEGLPAARPGFPKPDIINLREQAKNHGALTPVLPHENDEDGYQGHHRTAEHLISKARPDKPVSAAPVEWSSDPMVLPAAPEISAPALNPEAPSVHVPSDVLDGPKIIDRIVQIPHLEGEENSPLSVEYSEQQEELSSGEGMAAASVTPEGEAGAQPSVATDSRAPAVPGSSGPSGADYASAWSSMLHHKQGQMV
jgi:hypothetical protein